jgi:hypothetical protein
MIQNRVVNDRFDREAMQRVTVDDALPLTVPPPIVMMRLVGSVPNIPRLIGCVLSTKLASGLSQALVEMQSVL